MKAGGRPNMGKWTTKSDDEEVELLSHRKGDDGTDPPGGGRISVIRRRCRTLSGTNGWLRRSLFRGLGQDGKKMGDPP